MKKELYFDQNIKIEIAEKEMVDEALRFQKKIIDNMEKKNYFCPLTKEEFLTPILGRDNVYFLTVKNKIIGLFVATCDIDNILTDYQIENKNVLLIDSIMIKEEYRGNGFQRKILNFLFERAKELNVEGLIATVHPNNKYSLNNFLLEEYKIINEINIHQGIRYLLYKEVKWYKKYKNTYRNIHIIYIIIIFFNW